MALFNEPTQQQQNRPDALRPPVGGGRPAPTFLQQKQPTVGGKKRPVITPPPTTSGAGTPAAGGGGPQAPGPQILPPAPPQTGGAGGVPAIQPQQRPNIQPPQAPEGVNFVQPQPNAPVLTAQNVAGSGALPTGQFAPPPPPVPAPTPAPVQPGVAAPQVQPPQPQAPVPQPQVQPQVQPPGIQQPVAAQQPLQPLQLPQFDRFGQPTPQGGPVAGLPPTLTPQGGNVNPQLGAGSTTGSTIGGQPDDPTGLLGTNPLVPQGTEAIGLGNLGGLIERQLANPSAFGSSQVQDAFKGLVGQLDESAETANQRAIADAQSRGVFFGSPLTTSQGDIATQLQDAKGNLATQLLLNQAQTFGQDQNAAIGNAFRFGENQLGADQFAASLGLQSFGAGNQGAPNINSAANAIAAQPLPAPQGGSNAALGALGALFGSSPQQQVPAGGKSDGLGGVADAVKDKLFGGGSTPQRQGQGPRETRNPVAGGGN